MAQQLPCWWKAVEVVEDLEEMQIEHEADGVISLAEHRRQRAFVRQRVLRTVCNVARAQTIAQAVARNGEDSDRVLRLLREWGDDDPGPAAPAARAA